MTSRLASEPIRIELDGNPVELAPTLRAALRLARRYGTYGALVGKIGEGNVLAIADTIAEGSECPDPLPAILKEIEARGVLLAVASLQPALVDFVISLAGPAPDDDGKGGNAKTGSPITFDAFHEQLFVIATGCLGWTPREAWAATPAEILAAHKGRMAMLRMIFGSGDGTTAEKPIEELSLDEQALRVFGARKRKRA